MGVFVGISVWVLLICAPSTAAKAGSCLSWQVTKNSWQDTKLLPTECHTRWHLCFHIVDSVDYKTSFRVGHTFTIMYGLHYKAGTTTGMTTGTTTGPVWLSTLRCPARSGWLQQRWLQLAVDFRLHLHCWPCAHAGPVLAPWQACTGDLVPGGDQILPHIDQSEFSVLAADAHPGTSKNRPTQCGGDYQPLWHASPRGHSVHSQVTYIPCGFAGLS